MADGVCREDDDGIDREEEEDCVQHEALGFRRGSVKDQEHEQDAGGEGGVAVEPESVSM